MLQSGLRQIKEEDEALQSDRRRWVRRIDQWLQDAEQWMRRQERGIAPFDFAGWSAEEAEAHPDQGLDPEAVDEVMFSVAMDLPDMLRGAEAVPEVPKSSLLSPRRGQFAAQEPAERPTFMAVSPVDHDDQGFFCGANVEGCPPKVGTTKMASPKAPTSASPCASASLGLGVASASARFGSSLSSKQGVTNMLLVPKQTWSLPTEEQTMHWTTTPDMIRLESTDSFPGDQFDECCGKWSGDFFEESTQSKMGSRASCAESWPGLRQSEKMWAEMVTMVLNAAQKELRSLHKVWVQSDMFVMKSANAAHAHIKKNLHNQRITVSPFKGSMRRRSGSIAPKPKSMERHNGRDCIIMNPTSPKRLLWVFTGMALMLHDLVVLPLSVFDMEESQFQLVMQYFGHCYWTLDIGCSFITGVNTAGELSLDPVVIAKIYARTWLAFDCFVTFPPLIMFFFGWDSGSSSSIGAIRYVRMLRFLRLVRLAKFEHLLGEAMEFINSSAAVLTFGIVKLMIYLMLCSHFNACIWYFIGNRSDGWADPVGGHVAGRDAMYKYFCAVHWALTQFQGTSEIVPGTTLSERAYAAIFLLMALMILASFVSSLTNMMMQLQSLKDERNRTQRSIRSYLYHHKISTQLSMRVKNYVEWKLQMMGSQAHDEDVLRILPSKLVLKLHHEVRGPQITVCRFFENLDGQSPQILRRLCHETLQVQWEAPGEQIFCPSDDANRMHFITSGHLRYTYMPLGVPFGREQCSTMMGLLSGEEDDPPKRSSVEMRRRGYAPANFNDVFKGCWLCEAVLWVDWSHTGTLVAVTDASLIVLEHKDFARLIASSPPAHGFAVLYARQFVANLNRFGKTFHDFIEQGGIVDFDKILQKWWTPWEKRLCGDPSRSGSELAPDGFAASTAVL